MDKPRIIIADEDVAYSGLLQLKFAAELFDKISLEIITERSYFEELFHAPQKADVLIISDRFYNDSLTMHNNIDHIFLMTENGDQMPEDSRNVKRIYKYTNPDLIFNEIAGISALGGKLTYADVFKAPQIVVFYSVSGGVGKTLLSMSIAACLSKQFKKVLYINASHLQMFQYRLENRNPIVAIDTYAKLAASASNPYPILRGVIRKEVFSYIPPFKASLMSLGIPYSVYELLAVAAQKTGDYDFVIVDAESSFHKENISLLNKADKVIFVMNQTIDSVESMNRLVNNLNGINTDRHIFICNDFDKNKENALVALNKNLRFSVENYIEHLEDIEYREMAENEIIKKISIFLMS